MKNIIFFLVIFITSIAHADSIGVHANAARGLNETQCKTLLRAFDGVKNPKLSFLWSTFDRKQPKGFDCVRYFLNRVKNETSVIQVYADNSTCRRPPRYCEKTEVAPSLRFRELNAALERRDKAVLRDYGRRTRNVVDFLSSNTGSHTQISFVYALEDDFTSKAFKNVRLFVQDLIPSTWLKGRNPNGNKQNRYSYDGLDFIELHGFDGQFDGRAFSISNDGIDVNFGDGSGALNGNLPLSTMFSFLRKTGNSSNSVYRWIWWNNQNATNPFTPPSRRNYSINPRHIALINKEIRK